ncbi:uncharacterized protein K452DRAFT_142225 [Aplosporella prunicola CBS 121167]|uniref:Uncharacterized protein n=1 Tax=Aplosporella prunicola CBS 121167 TaxID=1176127 RepID=A0A6A6BMF5_9PEZI|nr:uncharacterized protein K452DRAFT_142225 [Aplosporella prunicola CBS 121167]KAF2144474.1 hypothetical protein K452DRAFT_142225 [Aplosporella prunicola CBS 121167]
MQLYGESARTLFVSTNGVLSFGPTIAYAPKLLPSTELPPYSVAPLWSDMVLPFQEASDGIWYEVDPVAQTVNVEWILGSAGDIYSLHQFQVRYEARLPNIVRFSYFTVAGNGVGASIGAQGSEFARFLFVVLVFMLVLFGFCGRVCCLCCCCFSGLGVSLELLLCFSSSLFPSFISSLLSARATLTIDVDGVAAQFAYNQRLLCPGTVVTCDTIANRCRNGTDTS